MKILLQSLAVGFFVFMVLEYLWPGFKAIAVPLEWYQLYGVMLGYCFFALFLLFYIIAFILERKPPKNIPYIYFVHDTLVVIGFLFFIVAVAVYMDFQYI